ncbi:adenylate kinase [Edaphobacter paludis]|uniref:Adenylate kinase n=1 Tax=Edaphobacter paludis TaxID=3035702 RepID=A0AAU7D048_9BACT
MSRDSAVNHSPAHADNTFLPGPVLLLGAPGVGKGTQAQLLMAAFGIPQISTGDILRENIAKGTELGKTAKGLMDRGQLVPDQVVNDMVQARLTGDDVHAGYILDGFPRTLAQATWLDAHLPIFRETPQLVAINIRVDEDELLRRITGRRTCSVCKHIYNIYSHPPAKPGICDIDGSPLQHRSDDTEEAFAERMKAYESLTSPVIEHYRASNRFRAVDGEAPVEQVAQSIVAALKELRQI